MFRSRRQVAFWGRVLVNLFPIEASLSHLRIRFKGPGVHCFQE